MEQKINKEKLDEILKEYQWEFESDYSCFEVSLAIDKLIKDWYGDKYLDLKLTVKDKETDVKLDILIDTEYKTYYNYWEDSIDEIEYAAKLWKYLYFALQDSKK